MELLLAGTASPIVAALAKRAEPAKLLLATDTPKLEENQEEERVNVVQWNRRSPIAARTLTLHACSVLPALDHAQLVFRVDRSRGPFHEQSATAFEQLIDADVKGYMFLARELVIRFSRIGAGTVDFILHDPAHQTVDPVAAASVGAFKAMVQSLFVLYQNEPFTLRGFSSEDDRVDEFAEFIWDTIREKGEKSTARWNRFGGKGGLFSFSRR